MYASLRAPLLLALVTFATACGGTAGGGFYGGPDPDMADPSVGGRDGGGGDGGGGGGRDSGGGGRDLATPPTPGTCDNITGDRAQQVCLQWKCARRSRDEVTIAWAPP